MLASGDRHGSLRELNLAFPIARNILVRPASIALAADGALHWIPYAFEARMGHGGHVPIVDIELLAADLELEVWVELYVDILRDALVRRVQVTNRADRVRDLRILFHHDLRLSPGEPRDAAYPDREAGALIHHGGRSVVLIGMESALGPGVALWKVASRASDAEPGAEALGPGLRLDGPARALGRVDSLVGAPIPLEPGASALVTVWLIAAETLREARARHESLRRDTIGRGLARTRTRWNLWLRAGSRALPEFPEDVGTLYERSLVLLRLHQTPGGAIASAGEDGVRWCRHREAAIAADALGRAGYPALTRRYLEFAARSAAESGCLLPVVDETGAPSGAPPDGAAPALVLWALARHFERERDVEFAAPLVQELAIPAADALHDSLDPERPLPTSYDLWMERPGIHAWTASVVRAGLVAAAGLGAAFGEERRARAWSEAADRIGRAMIRSFYRPEHGRFVRSVRADGRGGGVDPTLDASLLWLGLLDELEPEDSRVRATVERVRRELWVRTGVGGVARYEGDAPAVVEPEDGSCSHGGPSVAATLWLAQHAIRSARRAQDLDAARTLLLWCAARARGWSGLPERIDGSRAETGAACPHLPAHAWLVATVLDYVERLRALTRCERCGAPGRALGEREPAALATVSPPGLVAHA